MESWNIQAFILFYYFYCIILWAIRCLWKMRRVEKKCIDTINKMLEWNNFTTPRFSTKQTFHPQGPGCSTEWSGHVPHIQGTAQSTTRAPMSPGINGLQTCWPLPCEYKNTRQNDFAKLWRIQVCQQPATSASLHTEGTFQGLDRPWICEAYFPGVHLSHTLQ